MEIHDSVFTRKLAQRPSISLKVLLGMRRTDFYYVPLLIFCLMLFASLKKNQEMGSHVIYACFDLNYI